MHPVLLQPEPLALPAPPASRYTGMVPKPLSKLFPRSRAGVRG